MTQMAQKIFYPQHAKEAFPKDALERISGTIASVEESTNAEVRLSIRDIREPSESDLTLKELALKEFMTLGMHETAGRTGVLLLILYDERKFYIFGDEGVHRQADPETWEDVAQTLREHFREARFEEGVHAALRLVGTHVRGILPRDKTNPNELSDEVVIS
jgi:uncharacterized membrane protein